MIKQVLRFCEDLPDYACVCECVCARARMTMWLFAPRGFCPHVTLWELLHSGTATTSSILAGEEHLEQMGGGGCGTEWLGGLAPAWARMLGLWRPAWMASYVVSLRFDVLICKTQIITHLTRLLFSHSVVCGSCDPQTLAFQDPLSMGFSRQEYWSGLPFPSPRHKTVMRTKWHNACEAFSRLSGAK